MGILHTVNKSPFTHSTLASCLLICSPNDSILLLEDGVFGAIRTAPHAEKLQNLIQQKVKIYAMDNDVKARGLQEKLLQGIQLTSFPGFVELSIEHRCVQSWY